MLFGPACYCGADKVTGREMTPLIVVQEEVEVVVGQDGCEYWGKSWTA